MNKKNFFGIIIIFFIVLLSISTNCYADVVYTPSMGEIREEILNFYFTSTFKPYIILPLIIVYGILVIIIANRNKESKKDLIKKCLLLLLPMILILASIGLLFENIPEDLTDEKYGYVNSSGKTIIPYKYEEASEFSNGFAKIKLNGKYGFIDENGKSRIDCSYDNIDTYFDEYLKVTSYEYFIFYGHHAGNTIIPYNNLYGIIDNTRKTIIPTSYFILSEFKEDGYSYGLKAGEETEYYGYGAASIENKEFNKYNINSNRKIKGFYKIDKLGNETEITEDEFLEKIGGIKQAIKLKESTDMNKKGKNESDLIVKSKKVIKENVIQLNDFVKPILIDLFAFIIIFRLIKGKKNDIILFFIPFMLIIYFMFF